MRMKMLAGIVILSGVGATSSLGVPVTGLVAYLPFTSSFEDTSGNGLHGMPSGHVHITDGAGIGRFGGVAAFDGYRDWVVLPHIALNARPFAITMWLKEDADSASASGIIEQKAANATNKWFHVMTRHGHHPYLGFYGNDTESSQLIDTAWHHLVFQYTGSAQQIWVDGVMTAHEVAAAYAGDSGSTYIGKNPGWSNVAASDFKGYMDEFRVYDHALSQDEIRTVMDLPEPASLFLLLCLSIMAIKPRMRNP